MYSILSWCDTFLCYLPIFYSNVSPHLQVDDVVDQEKEEKSMAKSAHEKLLVRSFYL